MPTAYAYTGTLEHARRLGDAALAAPNGITVTFYSRDFPDGEPGAARAARTFQKTFSAMRAKSRRILSTNSGEHATHLDTKVLHKFDALACMRDALPRGQGWAVKLIPATMVHIGAIVTDNSTGAVVSEFDPNERIVAGFIDTMLDEMYAAQKAKRPPIYPLTEHEDSFARSVRGKDWDWVISQHGMKVGVTSPPPQPTASRPDPLDAMEADFFGGDKDTP